MAIAKGMDSAIIDPLDARMMANIFVAEALAPLTVDGCRIFHDVPAAAFNLDHVIVGPTGVFALETKTRRAGPAHTADGSGSRHAE
mgnify:CR=1 FL=1